MAKGTILFLLALAIIAVLLFGINIGKKIGNPVPITPSPTLITQLPTINQVSPTISNQQSAISNQSISTFTDETCGFSFSYPGSFMKQKTANQRSVIFADPNDPNVAVAATCAQTVPRPPVSANKQEQITLAGVPATLYHDQDPRGNLRDDIIVKHPDKDIEIIIAGYGELFETVRTTFRFL